jgi:pimeloyl-ACP methyl ester carboxylesterase
VLNDIGPFIPAAALQRLDTYTGTDPVFADLAGAVAYMREHYAPLGDLTEAQWQTMAESRTRPNGSGAYRLHYDPGIALNLHATADRDTDLWRLWDAIDCPVLVLRGEWSDLLLPDTVAEMQARGPGADVIEFTECGHNPPLLERSQIDAVVDWLDTPRAG